MYALGASTYFAYPKDKSTDYAIVIVPDVIGHESINVKLVADQFAENGYFTVIMDPFQGDPVPLNRPADYDIQKWLKGPPSKYPETVEYVPTSPLRY